MKLFIVGFLIGSLLVCGITGVVILYAEKQITTVVNSPLTIDPVALKSATKLLGTNIRPHCSAFVVSKKYAMTAAHCVEFNGNPFGDRDLIFDNKIPVVVHWFDSRLDIALLTGDFSKYKKLKLKQYHLIIDMKTNLGYACGYPAASEPFRCTTIKDIRNYNFGFSGYGHMIPGMSGGPVVDAFTGEVIGINSAVDDDKYIFADILPFLTKGLTLD